MWQLAFASCHCLKSNKKRTIKRVPDGHGQSFGSWPWQKDSYADYLSYAILVRYVVLVGDMLFQLPCNNPCGGI